MSIKAGNTPKGKEEQNIGRFGRKNSYLGDHHRLTK